MRDVHAPCVHAASLFAVSRTPFSLEYRQSPKLDESTPFPFRASAGDHRFWGDHLRAIITLTTMVCCASMIVMKVPLQQEILDVLKQKLLPEVAEIKADIVQIKADIKVINGRLDQMDKRFEQVDKRFEQVDKRFDEVDRRFDKVDEEMRDLKNDVREVRSYVFTSHLSEKTYSAVRDK